MPHQLGLQDHAVLRVERGERLVHQQHRRVGDEGARDRAALAHAAGELVRKVAAELGEADELERGVDPLRGFRGGNAARHQPEADIGLDAHPGEQPALLEHHRVLDRPAFGVDGDGAGGLVIEAGEDAQQRRLSAARRPDDAEELAGRRSCRSMPSSASTRPAALTYSLRRPAMSIAAPRRWTVMTRSPPTATVTGSPAACCPCSPARTAGASPPPRGRSWCR